jgi:hypothetical protein
MAIELLQPKQEKLRAIEITVGPKRAVLVLGQPLSNGKQVRVPEGEAADLVHSGQAKYITPGEVKRSEK